MSFDTHFIDLHLHPSLKPYHRSAEGVTTDIWEEVAANEESYRSLSKPIRKTIAELARGSQTNLKRFKPGRIRGGLFTLYSIERGLFRLCITNLILRLFLKKRHYPHLGATISGIPFAKVQRILMRIENGQGIDYYEEELLPEYRYVVSQANTNTLDGRQLVIARDYDHFKSTVVNQPDAIVTIFNIEGAHSLCSYKRDKFFSLRLDFNQQKYFFADGEPLSDADRNEIEQCLLISVDRIKGKTNDPLSFAADHTPFYLTFCHMFWNLMAGHAKSFGAKKGLLQPGMENLFDQKLGQNEGITPLGKIVIEALLNRDNGRRILIDIKHMSLKSRLEYYRIIRNKRETENDLIPILCTHGAMNGFEDMASNLQSVDDWSTDKNAYFSRWSINLNNEDIREIHASSGLIGLVFHEFRVPGGKAKRQFELLKKKGNKSDLKKAYIKLIMSNIFQVIQVVRDKSAWDMICLGSDFDGLVDPYNSYASIDQFKDFAKDMGNFLSQPEDLIGCKNNQEGVVPAEKVKELMYGYNAEELVAKFSHQNLEGFLKKYFNKAYLEKPASAPIT